MDGVGIGHASPSHILRRFGDHTSFFIVHLAVTIGPTCKGFRVMSHERVAVNVLGRGNLIFGIFPFVAAVLISLMREDSPQVLLWLSIVRIEKGKFDSVH